MVVMLRVVVGFAAVFACCAAWAGEVTIDLRADGGGVWARRPTAGTIRRRGVARRPAEPLLRELDGLWLAENSC